MDGSVGSSDDVHFESVQRRVLEKAVFLGFLVGSIQGFASNKEIHGRENAQKSTFQHRVCSRLKDGRHLGTAGSRQSKSLQGPDHVCCGSTSCCRGAQDGQIVPEGVCLTDIALQGVVPLDLVLGFAHVLMFLDREADSLQSLEAVLARHHLGDAVADLQSTDDSQVFWVGGVVLVSHDPFVTAKDTTGLQDSVGLSVDTLQGRGMDGGLDSVAGVIGSILQGHVHEVTLDKVRAVLESKSVGIATGTRDLVVVVVEAGDVGSGEVTDLAGGTTDTTADIEDLERGLDTHVGGQVVLMTGHGLLEGLTRAESAEVERGAPGVLSREKK